MITFRSDLTDLAHFAEEIERLVDELPETVSRAINRTGDMMTTAIGRTLSKETGLGVRDVESGFEVEHATPADPVFTLTVPSRVTTLGEYQPRPTRKGKGTLPDRAVLRTRRRPRGRAW